jgi:hypothetical protein
MKNSIFKILLTVLIIYLTSNIIENIIINDRYMKISKTDSSNNLRDFRKYDILIEVVNKYTNYIVQDKYNELSHITLFEANKKDEFYINLKKEYGITTESVIKIDSIKVLSEDVYKCNYNIESLNISIVVKLNENNSSFRIINVIV